MIQAVLIALAPVIVVGAYWLEMRRAKWVRSWEPIP